LVNFKKQAGFGLIFFVVLGEDGAFGGWFADLEARLPNGKGAIRETGSTACFSLRKGGIGVV